MRTYEYRTITLTLLDRTGDARICPAAEQEIEESMDAASRQALDELGSQGFEIKAFAPLYHDSTRSDIGAYRFVLSRNQAAPLDSVS